MYQVYNRMTGKTLGDTYATYAAAFNAARAAGAGYGVREVQV